MPKTLALLEEQLIRLQGQLAPCAEVIAGAMVKHLPLAVELLAKHRAAGDKLVIITATNRFVTAPIAARLA